MGQQQILFVILAACVIAIAVSIGVISRTGQATSDNRSLLEQDLKVIAKKAQDFVSHSPGEGDGGISFYVLTRLPDAIKRLGCSPSNAHGDFFMKQSATSSFIQIIGVGNEAGYDKRRPSCLIMTVWADSTSLTALN